MFTQLDESKDGMLSRDEIEKGLDKLVGHFGEMDYEELLLTMDKDGDGQVDYQEFISAAIDKQTLLNHESVMHAF